MDSVFKEIVKLRTGKHANFLDTWSNRYTIHCEESHRVKTAYCFSVPIRNIKTDDIVDLRFYHKKHESAFVGSEAKILITDKVQLLNQYGMCDVIIEGCLFKRTDKSVFFVDDKSHIEIRPTLNGIMLTFECEHLSDYPKISLRFNRSFNRIRANSKSFSVMRKRFVPFITVSCIGIVNDCGKVLAPCKIHKQMLNDLEYDLTFYSTNRRCNRIAVEINMQEEKLFEDTTVEREHPTLNNAFGGMSFLGNSKLFGEQVLYSRLQISKLSGIQNKKIIKSILHIPQLGYNRPQITANRISERFCSFRSNWENKIAITDAIANSSASNGYYHLDMTNFLEDFTKESENFVIRATSTNKPVIIPTGDNFYAPQILEVRYE